jgi:probable F420-dependent oxidoreductase
MPVRIAGREVTFGLWYDFRNPETWKRNPHELYARTFEHIRYAERLGFEHAWTSEHHFIDDGYSPSLLPICAAIASQTTRIRIGTNVLLLPLHDPVRIAEDAATVDVISGGRMDLGVAVGYKREEFTGFGISRSERGRRMDEAVECIRKAWSPGAFSFEGHYYRYTDINVTPKPLQAPMPLWVGGFTEPAVRRAARVGDGLLAAANVIPTFLDEWGTCGRTGTPRIALSLPWAMVAEDPDKAWAEIAPHIFYQRQAYARWFGAAGMDIFRGVPETAEAIREGNPDIVVTPERARELVESIIERLPMVTNLYWWAIPPGVDPKTTFESAELFSRAVLTNTGRR